MVDLRCPACDSANVHSSGLSGEAVCEDCGTLVDDNGTLLVHRQLDEDASTFFAGTQRIGQDGRTAVGGAPRGKGVQQSQINKERREVRPRFASPAAAAQAPCFAGRPSCATITLRTDGLPPSPVAQREAKIFLASLGRYFQASNVVDRALHFYLIAARDRPTSERQTVILATAAFALSMKERSRAETLRQFCVRLDRLPALPFRQDLTLTRSLDLQHFTDQRVLPVTRMYLKLRQTTGAKVAETDPSVFVEQLLVHLSAICADSNKGLTVAKWLAKGRGNTAGTLRFLQETDLRQVRETALALAEWVHSIDLFVGRHAVSVAIGLVLMAIEGTRQIKLPKVVDVADELAKANGVAAWTSMERYRETARALLDWSEHLPGIDLNVRTLTVNELTGWKNRAVCKRKEVASLVLDVLDQQATIRTQRRELGLEVGCSGGAVADRPPLTFAEFVKLEQAQEGAGDVKDIGAWGANAASGAAALPLPTWDDLDESEAPDIGEPRAIELAPTPGLPPSAQQLAISTDSYHVEAPPPFTAHSPVFDAVDGAGLDALPMPDPFDMGVALDPPPLSPGQSQPELDDTAFFQSAAPSAFLPPPRDTFADEGSFAGPMSAAYHDDSSAATAYGDTADSSLMDPSLLADVEPEPFGGTACPAATSHGQSSGQSSVSSAEVVASPDGVPNDAPDPAVPQSEASVVASEAAPILVTPSFKPNHLGSKHLRPAAYMRYRPTAADRQRSLWLSQDVINAVRTTGNDTTALGKLLCAGLNANDLPAFLAPTSTLGAVAALRQGGSLAIDDDELFTDGELDAYVRPDTEREFLLELWEKDGTSREMDEAATKSVVREEALRKKAARKRTRVSTKASSSSQYAGSRRTKAKQGLDADAIALLLGESGSAHAGGGGGSKGDDDVHDDDDGSQAGTGSKLDALVEEFGEPTDDEANWKADVDDDDSSEDDDDGARSVAGKKRARAGPQDEADLKTFFKRARVLYDDAEGADDDEAGEEV